MAEIRSSVSDTALTIFISGRLDYASSLDAEKSVADIISSSGLDNLIFDLSDTEYVSSSGIRIIIRSKKTVKTVSLINVPPSVYEVFELAGLTEVIPVSKAFKQVSIEGCRILGHGATGTVYRYDDDTIIKVFKPSISLKAINRERELSRKAFILGVPTALSYDIVKVGENYGTMLELIDSKSVTELLLENPDDLDKYAAISADLLREMHSLSDNSDILRDEKLRISNYVADCSNIFDSGIIEKLNTFVDSIPYSSAVLHADYHTNNIMIQNGEPILIDMATLSRGNPVYDLASTYYCLVAQGFTNPETVTNFIGMPYELSVEFWDRFIYYYLGDRYEAEISSIMRKLNIIACLRTLHHCALNDRPEEFSMQRAEASRSKLLSLLENE